MAAIWHRAFKSNPIMRTHFLRFTAVGVTLFLPITNRAAETKGEFNGATPLQWSQRMADSQMARSDGRLAWKAGGGGGKWDYTAGLFTLSLLKLNERAPNPALVTFATNAIGTFVTTDGNLTDYHPAEYQLDAINPGKTVIALYRSEERRVGK